jgi:hypothetical protein
MEAQLNPKPTECKRVLQALKDVNGAWVNGRHFLHELFLSQYHARIFETQHRGHQIEANESADEYGFESYRLVQPYRVDN